MLRCNIFSATLLCRLICLSNPEERPVIISLFNKTMETPQALPESLLKANKLFIANMENILVFQVNALKSYMDMGVNQLRAAAEITDLESLYDFYKRQAEIAETMQRKLMNDARIMSGMATHFQTEIENLTKTALDEVLPKAA